MPVIQISLAHLKSFSKGKASEKQIIDSLPYVGLDIENQEGEKVAVEYSPNRPDFSSEAGIARSLLGILKVETGAPKYEFPKSALKINVENDGITKARPFISGFLASIGVTDELIKDLINMQEDLTNGIGRRRSKVAIGIHDAEVIKPPISYFATTDKQFSFVPLYGSKPETIETILEETVQGRQYSNLVSSGVFPMLRDSSGNVLSMPPIINGELTRLKPGIRKLFFDVTSTEKSAGDTVSAIMASMLSDIGAKVESVEIGGSLPRITPDMTEKKMRLDLSLTNSVLGLHLSMEEAKEAIARSRLTLESEFVRIPAFRNDIIHPVDLVEEVALGYGVGRLTPQSADTSLSGSIHERSKKISSVVDVLIGLGLVEIFNLSLESRAQTSLAEDQSVVLKVEDAKSESYEFLKSELLPSLLGVLGSSTHEEYPQRVFEVAPVFKKSLEITQVKEEEHAAIALAHSSANFSEIKSVVEGFLRLVLGRDLNLQFTPGTSRLFSPGRSASVRITKSGKSEQVGLLGEIAPEVLEKVGLKVPVAAFEIDLSWKLA